MKKEIRYLALGDSYTIGESVEKEGSFPHQLAALLELEETIVCTEIKIVAKTGWTTAELKEGIKRAKPKGIYQLVTLLIGVNNQYRGYDMGIYLAELKELLDKAIAFAGGDPGKVVVVSIPDYGCTPFGKDLAQKIDLELREYNQVAEKLANQKGTCFVDIFQISKKAETNPNLIAADNLHPSADMYQLWAEAILPVATPIVSLP